MTGRVKGNLPAGGQEFGARLRTLMFERRVGSGALARETGIDVRLIRKYRSGMNRPVDYFGDPTGNALKIARALGVSAGELIGGGSYPEEKAA